MGDQDQNTFTSCCGYGHGVVGDVQGQEIEGAGEGFLCMKAAWPSTIRTIFGDQDRFETTYFAPFKVSLPDPWTFLGLATSWVEDGVGGCPVPGWLGEGRGLVQGEGGISRKRSRALLYWGCM